MEQLAFISAPGPMEIFIIFVIVLLIFGPKSIPKLARSLGSGIREFKDAANKMTENIMEEDQEEERRPQNAQSRPKKPLEDEPENVSQTKEKETETEKAP